MKKILLIPALLLSVHGAMAQPALTGNDIFSVGSSDSFSTGIFNDIYGVGMAMESMTGTNYTWDFSNNVFFLGGAFDYSCTTPPTSLFPYLLPGTNMRESAPASSIENLFQRVPDTLYMMRAGSSVSSGAYMVPKLRWMTFPLNFGDSLYVKQLEYVDTGMVTEGFTRTHSYKYDGFGTVKLPWGDYANIFRVKITTRDSSHVVANYINTYSGYLFFRQGGGMPIARLISSAPNSDSISHAYTLIANKTATAPSAISTINGQNDVQVYPNPVRDMLYITSAAKAGFNITVADMVGRILISAHSVGATIQVSVAGLAKGMYLVTIRDEANNIISCKKLIKTE